MDASLIEKAYATRFESFEALCRMVRECDAAADDLYAHDADEKDYHAMQLLAEHARRASSELWRTFHV
jgi:hypothetical protein